MGGSFPADRAPALPRSEFVRAAEPCDLPMEVVPRNRSVATREDRRLHGDRPPLLRRRVAEVLLETVDAEQERHVLVREVERKVAHYLPRDFGSLRVAVELGERRLRPAPPLVLPVQGHEPFPHHLCELARPHHAHRLGRQRGIAGYGGSHADVAAAVLVFRALTYVLPIPIGLGTYLFWKRNRSWRRAPGTAPRTDLVPESV